VNSDLIRVPPAASLRTLLCNVDIKVTLLRTVHARDTVETLKKEAPDLHTTTNTLTTEQFGP